MTSVLTRRQVTAALTAAGRPDLADGIYARRLDYDDAVQVGHGSALALDVVSASDQGVLVLALASLLGQRGALEVVAGTRTGLPAHPDGRPARYGVWWPTLVLDEPTWEAWTDRINSCPDCTVLDDDRCPAHAVAPWETAPAPVPVP